MWRVMRKGCVFRMSVTMPVVVIPSMRGTTFSMRCVLSPATVRIAESSNMFSESQLQYMHATRGSKDARDVVWHRALMKQINPDGPEREINNSIMHAMDFAFTDIKTPFNRKK